MCVAIMLRAVLLFSAAMSATIAAGLADDAEGPLTHSPSGAFRGSWMETRRGRRFQAYRGIRYAEPPVGELRFKPPKPILKYKGEVDASQEGPASPQPAPKGYYIDEDCLRVNVYTPDNNSSKLLPVIFFMHPGGFYSMSGRSDLAGPHYLLDRDVVLVTINYRLSTLGFMATGDEIAPGNNGMKDQVAALRWVQRNIAAFGGDPNLVTITGCSAGSTSVMLHMVSPMSKGLFHRAISLSASPITKGPLPTEQRNQAIKQAEILNCSTNSTRAIYDCLMTKPWKEIGDSLPRFFDRGYDSLLQWQPVVEPDFGQERFLTMQPLDAIRQGKMHAVPYIISQTKDEFFWLCFRVLKNETTIKTFNEEWDRVAPISFNLPDKNAVSVARRLKQEYLGGKDLRNDEATARGLGNIYSDTFIAFGANRLAKLMSRYSPHPVFYTEFSYMGNHSHYEDPTTKKPMGTAHHDDLIYLFSLSYNFPTIAPSTTNPDSRVVDQMTAMWYNFARYGDPNPCGDTPELGSLMWPAFTPTENNYLRVGEELTVHQNLYEDRFKVWEELYPIEY